MTTTTTNSVIASAVTEKNVSVVLQVKGKLKPYNIDSTHPNFDKIRTIVLSKKNLDTLEELINVAKAVENWANNSKVKHNFGRVTVEGGVIKFAGVPVHGALSDRILAMLREGYDASALINFLNNVQANPSPVAREELFAFLEGNRLPITPEGMFTAYKRVRGDFKDIYTGTMDNSPGNTVTMDRTKVDPNRNNTCSNGLHFASLEYACDHYGSGRGADKMLVLEIDPSDVVAIPTDYNRQKGRTWKYKVIAEVSLDVLKEEDLLENISVLDNKTFKSDEEDYTTFLRNKASQQKRDKTGRFV